MLVWATAVRCGTNPSAPETSGSATATGEPRTETAAVISRLGSPVRAELISDIAIVQPGEIFRLGVLLTLQPGWYVHWANPGGSGEPVSVDLRLPSGFEAGSLRWPIPVQFEQPNGTIGYGYQDEVLLYAEVRASNRDVDDGEMWLLMADVRWLACERECVPGHSTLELSLPGSISGTRLVDLVNAPRVEAWLSRVPVDAGSPSTPFTATLSRGGPEEIVLLLSWRLAPSNVQWFPSSTTADAVPISDLDGTGRRTRIVLLAPTVDDAFDLRIIDGVVAYTDAAGERHAAELSVAVDGLSKP